MKTFKKIISVALVFALVFACIGMLSANAASSGIVIDVKGGEPYTPISDHLFGIFFEDINFAADGGLSANLIRNNSFEQKLAWAPDYDCRMTGWEIISGEGYLLTDAPMNDKNPNYYHTAAAGVIANYGYPDKGETYGILLKKGETYDLSFYVRGAGKAGVSFTDAEGKSVFSKEYDFSSPDRFTKIRDSFTPSAKAYTRLEISLPEGADTDFYNLISQKSFGYGDSTWKYSCLRADLVEALKNLNPAFMRFPGGCLAEGAYDWEYAYNWKTTLGEPEQRKQIPNIWGYNQSLAIGFYEYFCLCDYLDAEPLPVVHAGLMCQGRGTWLLDTESDEFAQHIQDILDLIEYANGDISTEWGAVRAENGHPEPFNLKYLAVGNENWMEDYWERFDIIYNVIKREHPEITVISSAGAWADGKEWEYAWEQIDEKYTDTIVDEHYYVPYWWPYANYEKYDNYDRNSAKVFVGEYAVHREGGDQITKNNLKVAIDEAVHCTSLVRNGDIVDMACYAPLFARDGYTQWAPNLIWYNSDETVVTPSYYVQQLYMNNTGTAKVNSTLTGGGEDIYQVVSIDEESKNIYIAVVNTSSDSKSVRINLDGFDKLDTAGEVRYLGSGLYNMSNNFGTLNNFIKPEYQKFAVTGNSVTRSVGPYSLNMICLSYGGANTYTSLTSDTGYSHGSAIRTFFYNILAKIVVWFTATDFYHSIEEFIKEKIISRVSPS